MGRSRPLFVYFHFFHLTQFKYKLIKALMVCSMGLEPGAAGWKVHTAYKSTELWRHPTKLFTIEGMRQQGGLLRVRLLRGLRAGRQKNLRPSPNARTH